MEDLPKVLRPLVLTVALDRPLDETCRQLFRTVDVDGAEGVLRQFHEHEISVFILGPRLTPVEAQGILASCVSEFPVNSTAIVVLCAGSDRNLLQGYVDEGLICYLSRGPVTDEQLRSLLVSAATRFGAKVKPESDTLAVGLINIGLVLDFCARLPMQADLSGAGRVVVQTVRDLIHVDSARCFICDSGNEVLTPSDAITGKERAESASAGLVGFVVRTGEGVCLDRAGTDARYDCDTDNPGGTEDVRFIAEPIFGDRKWVAGVITAVRNNRSASFSADDRRMLALLAECAAPTFCQILWRNRLQALLANQAGTTCRVEASLAEAAEYDIQTSCPPSDSLQILPRWLCRMQWALVALAVVSLLGGIFGKVNEYVSGPAMVRARDIVTATAGAPGRVYSVEVSVGNRVKAGDILVRLDGAIGPTPSKGNREQVLAPDNGIVGEILVRSGQLVNQGEQVVSIVKEQSGYDLVAFLPSSYAQQLRPGMPMRVKVRGDPRLDEFTRIDSVSHELLALREAARNSGMEDFRGTEPPGPVVMVRSFLRSTKLMGDAGSNSYLSGMAVEVDVRIRSEPIIVWIFPASKRIFGMQILRTRLLPSNSDAHNVPSR
jgi:biotin carboxyl carrier protein